MQTYETLSALRPTRSDSSRLNGLVLFVLLFSGCATEWERVVSTRYRFEVLMPSTPSTSSYQADSDRWRGETSRLNVGSGWRTLIQPERSLIFWARAEDVPSGWTNEQVVTRYINERTKEFGISSGSEPKTVGHKGMTGFEFRLADSGVQLISRVFLMNGVAYSLEVMGSDSDVTPEVVNKFFDSLRVFN